MHILLVQPRWEELDVAPATVDALLVLHCELDDQWLALVAEVIKAGGEGVETGVLAGLEAYMGKHNEWDTILDSTLAFTSTLTCE